MTSTEGFMVQRFYNDAKKEKSLIKMRSFNLFYQCELKCLKDIKAKDTENCLQRCEGDLDNYYEHKKKNKVFDGKKFIYGLIGDGGLTPDEHRQYQRNCVNVDIEMQNQISKLKSYLNNWEANIKKQ